MDNIIEFLFETFGYLIFGVAIVLFVVMHDSMSKTLKVVQDYEVDNFYSITTSIKGEKISVYGYEILSQYSLENNNIASIYVNNTLLTNENYDIVSINNLYEKEEYIQGETIITSYKISR